MKRLATHLATSIVGILLAACTITLAEQRPPDGAASEPAAPNDEQIQQWIKQLGDEDFQTREAAQRSLVAAGNPAYFTLDVLPPSDDPEVKACVERTLTALEDDAAEQLRKLGASVLKRDGASHWNYVDFENPDARDEDLAPLLRLRHLEHLELEEAPFTDHVLDYCRHMTKLREFYSYRTEISDVGLEKLAHFRKLERVGLLLPKMTNEGFAALATLPNLRTLAVFDAPIDGDGLAHLGPLKDQMIALALQGTRVSDDDLVHLRDFPALRSLRLSDTKVNGKGLSHISELPQLESLLLYRLSLDDEAFPHIAKMPKLQTVSLNDAGVTRENLLMLSKSQSLVRIRVSPEEFTAEEVQAIQKKFDERDLQIRTRITR